MPGRFLKLIDRVLCWRWRRVRGAWFAAGLVGLGLLSTVVGLVLLGQEATAPPVATTGGEAEAEIQPQAAVVEEEASPYAALAEPMPTATPGRTQPTAYEVQADDTLLAIADRFGLRPESVLWANDLPDPDLIVVGQKLVIPPADGLLYEVEEGEGLWAIANRYGLETAQVAAANAIENPDQIPTGAQLFLPGARPLAPSRALAAGPNTARDTVEAPLGDPSLAAELLNAPLPDNLEELLTAAWVKSSAPSDLFSGPEAGARRYVTLPEGVRLERVGDLAGRRIPVRDPGDGRTRQAMSGWVDVDGLVAARAPSPRELPRGYPAVSRMDIFQAFVPFQGQLDGTPWAAANCGPTSVAMVLASFGIEVSSGKVRAQVLETQKMWGNHVGTLITALAQVTESYGLQVHDLREDGAIKRWTLDDIRDHLRTRHPVLVQVRYRALPGREGAAYYGDHYIVVTGILDDGFTYNDPIDHDGPGWDRVISGERLLRAMDTSDRRYVYAAFAISQ